MALFKNRFAPGERGPNQPDKGIQARSLFSFCAFHFIDDGFADSVYVLLPFITAELSLSFSQVGLLTGVFFGAMSLLQVPLSLVGERIGELTVVGAGTFGLAGGFFLLSRAYTFPIIFLSLIVAKGTAAGQHGLSSSVLSKVFEVSGRRAAMGTYNFSGDLGKVCLPFLLTFMINLWGWRHAISILSIGGIAAGVLLWILVQREKGPSSVPPTQGKTDPEGEGLGNPRPGEVFDFIGHRNHRSISPQRFAHLPSFSPFAERDSGYQNRVQPYPPFCGRGFRKVCLWVSGRMVRDYPHGGRNGSLDSCGNPVPDLVPHFSDLDPSSLGWSCPERDLVRALRYRCRDHSTDISLARLWTLLCHYLGLRGDFANGLRLVDRPPGSFFYDHGHGRFGFIDPSPEPVPVKT